MAVSGAELTVSNESLFFSRLTRIRIEPKPFSNGPRLYVLEGGRKNFFAVPKSARAIQFSGIDRVVDLPEGSLFRVGSNARVMMGPGNEYQLYKFMESEFLEKDQVVLVLKRVGHWYQIRLGKEEVGYILASYLVSITGNEADVPHELRTPCDLCETKGYQVNNVIAKVAPGRERSPAGIVMERAKAHARNAPVLGGFLVESAVQKAKQRVGLAGALG